MKVEEKDLVGKIKDFPLHVVQAMLDEQVRQGHKANPSVFAESPWSGFTWEESRQGHGFWRAVIVERKFDLISKPEEKEFMSESIKPKRKIIQVSESITSNGEDMYPWNLTALCDDGSVWVRSNYTDDWKRLPDIPQDGCDDCLTFHKTGCDGYVPRGSD